MLKHLIYSLACLTIFFSCALLALDGRLFKQKPIFQIVTENRIIIDGFLIDFYRQIAPLLDKGINESEKASFARAYEKYLQEFKNPNSLVIQALKEKCKIFTLSYYTPVFFRHLQQFYLFDKLVLAWSEYNQKKPSSLGDAGIALLDAQTYLNSISPIDIINFVMNFEILIKQFNQINDYNFREQIKDDSFFSSLIINVIDASTFAEHLSWFPPTNLIFLPSHDRNDDASIDFKFPKVMLFEKREKEQKIKEWIDFLWIFGYPIGLLGYHSWAEPVFDAFHTQAKKALNYKGDLGKIIYPIALLPDINLTINEISFLNGRTYFSSDPANNNAVLKDFFYGLVSYFSTNVKIENYLAYAYRINRNVHLVKEPGDETKTLRWHVLNRFLSQTDAKKTSEFFVLLKQKYPDQETITLAEEIKKALDDEDEAKRNELNKSVSTFVKNSNKKKKKKNHSAHVRTKKSKSAPTSLITKEKRPLEKVELDKNMAQQAPKTVTPKPSKTKNKNRKKRNTHSTPTLPQSVIEDLLPFKGPRLDLPPPIVLRTKENVEENFDAKKELPLVEHAPLVTQVIEEAPRPKNDNTLTTIKNGVKRIVKAVKDPSTAVQNVVNDRLFRDMMKHLTSDMQRIATHSRKDIEYQKEYNHIVAQMFEAVQRYQDSLLEYKDIINKARASTNVLNVPNLDHDQIFNPNNHQLIKYSEDFADITRILCTYSLPRYGFDLAQMRNFSNYHELMAMVMHPHDLLNLERAQLIHDESNQYGKFREPVVQEAKMRLNTILAHLGELEFSIKNYAQAYKQFLSQSLCPTNDK